MFANIRRPLAASLFGSAFVLTALSTTTLPAVAQVSGGVVITSGPVQGRIAVGEPVFAPRPIVVYQPVRGRRMEVARYAQQVVFIERGHGRHGKSAQWYHRHGYRPATLYYSQGRYFSLVSVDRRYRRGGYFLHGDGLGARWPVLPAGGGQSGSVRVHQQLPQGTPTRLVSIPLSEAPEGESALVLTVRDEISGRTLEARAPFRVEPRPASLPAVEPSARSR